MSYSHDDHDPAAGGQPGGSDPSAPGIPSWRQGENDERFEMPGAQPEEHHDLGASLRGYDAAAPEEEHLRETRLCPACSKVGTFVDGRCLNCGFKSGVSTAAAMAEAHELRSAVGGGGEAGKWIAIALAVVLLVVAGIYVLPMLTGKNKSQPISENGEVTPVPKAGSPTPAGLNAVEIDETFYTNLENDLKEANRAWENAGVKAYVYRYNVLNTLVPATSQDLGLTMYVAGADADSAVKEPQDKLFLDRIQTWTNQMNSRGGVKTYLELRPISLNDTVQPDDRYIVFGAGWGHDHKELIDKITGAIGRYKDSNQGQYPLELDGGLTAGLQTAGNPSWVRDGVGYLPVLKTDGAGNVVMGSGKGLSAFTPEAVTGYYLFFFLDKKDAGLDVYDEAGLTYYTEKISPFPYKPEGKLHNVKLAQDGKPDGIACVVKDGKVL